MGASMRFLCLWESVYPTTAEECVKTQQIKGHSLVAFITACLAPGELSSLRLQASECDSCVWLPLDVFRKLHGSLASTADDTASISGWRLLVEGDGQNVACTNSEDL